MLLFNYYCAHEIKWKYKKQTNYFTNYNLYKDERPRGLAPQAVGITGNFSNSY